MKLQGQRALVVGMEASGKAAVKFLLSQGAEVTASDMKAVQGLDVPFVLQSDELFDGAFDLIVPSPGVPFDLPGLLRARARGVKVIGEVELAAPYLRGKVIGITGTNGKTTTASLTGHILHQSGVPMLLGGNIGRPVTDMIADSRQDQWNVLELSSFQLESVETFRAHIAVGLNLTQNHLDRHHTLEAYAAAKGHLFHLQSRDDAAVLNFDDSHCRLWGQITPGTVVWFSSHVPETPGWVISGEDIRFEGQKVIALDEIPIRGRHNAENTMAAGAAAHLAGVPLDAIAAAVRTFKAVEHRLEFVRRLNGVDFYNDSKATSVDATLKALDSFPGGLWVILGGKDKGSDYHPLRAPLREKARGVLLIGAAAGLIASHLDSVPAVIQSGTLAAAVQEAYSRAQPGDTVLLAPACASFDQFTSYEHRGRVFKEVVGGLKGIYCTGTNDRLKSVTQDFKEKDMALRLKTDWILFTTVILLVFFGAVMIYSASSVKAEQKLGSSYYYIGRQMFWVAIGLGVMMLLKRVSYRKLQHPGVAFTCMGVVLILLIIVFIADPKQHRWIRFGSLGQLQPSEFAKPAMMLFLAFFVAMRSRAINNKHTLLPAALAVGVVTVLVGLADLGTAVVIFLSAALVFVVAGLDKRFIGLAVIFGVLAGIGLVIQKPYRLKRIILFLDPHCIVLDKIDPKGHVKAYMNQSVVAKDTNYQVDQSKIAVGSGGLTGLGLMGGRQKLLFLPEPHTDMVYAVVGEEFGLIGTSLVLVAFIVIFWRGIRAAVLVPDEFGRYLALGITLALGIQALMNMSVVLGMGPTKGIPLPMISYGGTSLLSTLAGIGVLLNVSEHAG